MLYLCEKHGPMDSLERYNPERDIKITGAYVPFTMKELEWQHRSGQDDPSEEVSRAVSETRLLDLSGCASATRYDQIEE